MKLISWNVNGIRAALNKGLADFISTENPDILCLQETKAREEQVELPLEFGAYQSFWNSAEKPGYSGTAIFTKEVPLDCMLGLGIPEHDTEGRVITLEYHDFFLVNVYTVNAQDGLRRLPYRLEWDAAFRNHLLRLKSKKSVIFCGDLNVAHKEIDLARPASNRNSPGFSDEERASFTTLLESGFVDSYRHFHPEKTEAYSWWSYRGGARERNVGWRIDYFGLTPSNIDRHGDASILPHIIRSDHCPVAINLH
jgi:exodeoxyribonuclease-3